MEANRPVPRSTTLPGSGTLESGAVAWIESSKTSECRPLEELKIPVTSNLLSAPTVMEVSTLSIAEVNKVLPASVATFPSSVVCMEPIATLKFV